MENLNEKILVKNLYITSSNEENVNSNIKSRKLSQIDY
jgi:hypothetical protein